MQKKYKITLLIMILTILAIVLNTKHYEKLEEKNNIDKEIAQVTKEISQSTDTYKKMIEDENIALKKRFAEKLILAVQKAKFDDKFKSYVKMQLNKTKNNEAIDYLFHAEKSYYDYIIINFSEKELIFKKISYNLDTKEFQNKLLSKVVYKSYSKQHNLSEKFTKYTFLTNNDTIIINRDLELNQRQPL